MEAHLDMEGGGTYLGMGGGGEGTSGHGRRELQFGEVRIMELIAI